MPVPHHEETTRAPPLVLVVSGTTRSADSPFGLRPKEERPRVEHPDGSASQLVAVWKWRQVRRLLPLLALEELLLVSED